MHVFLFLDWYHNIESKLTLTYVHQYTCEDVQELWAFPLIRLTIKTIQRLQFVLNSGILRLPLFDQKKPDYQEKTKDIRQENLQS